MRCLLCLSLGFLSVKDCFIALLLSFSRNDWWKVIISLPSFVISHICLSFFTTVLSSVSVSRLLCFCLLVAKLLLPWERFISRCHEARKHTTVVKVTKYNERITASDIKTVEILWFLSLPYLWLNLRITPSRWSFSVIVAPTIDEDQLFPLSLVTFCVQFHILLLKMLVIQLSETFIIKRCKITICWRVFKSCRAFLQQMQLCLLTQ